jgi:3-dehydroquinate synthetase
VAVAQGLIFAIKWSQHQGYLAATAEERALAILIRLGFPMPKGKRVTLESFLTETQR